MYDKLMNTDKNKEQFLLNEYQNMSILAALSTRDKKNPVYIKSPAKEKEARLSWFKKYLKTKLDQYTKQYKDKINENKHNENIEKLTQEITAEYQDILHEGNFRIGITQKLLNLYLKYLWVSDRIPTPPHCPFDSIVISNLGLKNIKWTALKDIKEYKLLVEEAKKFTKGKNLSLSEWELELWNQKQKKNFIQQKS